MIWWYTIRTLAHKHYTHNTLLLDSVFHLNRKGLYPSLHDAIYVFTSSIQVSLEQQLLVPKSAGHLNTVLHW